ncbi:MAG: ABC transporter ATP-binding protein [Planctomycetota bacterium]
MTVATAELAVHVSSLTKRFADREALSAIDLQIPRGSCFGLFGPNGSGKTTLLKILATLMRSSSGTVEVAGCALPAEALHVRSRLGILLDRPLFPVDFTLSEGLRYYAALHQLVSPGARIDAMIERVGLVWRTRDPIRTFSRGMAQRVSLLCALIADPEILILDEPFTGLDRRGCELVEEAIHDQNRAGKTVILVTHDLERGGRLCDEVAVLERGQVAYRGTKGAWSLEDVAAVYK